MTSLSISISFGTLRRAGKFLVFAAAASAMTLTAARASLLCKPIDSSLPIRSSTDISNPRAFETAGRLIVTGSVSSTFRSPTAHVDIQLVGNFDQIVAWKIDSITWAHPRTVAGRHGVSAFSGGFPLKIAQQATQIVVSFKNGSHSKCVAVPNI